MPGGIKVYNGASGTGRSVRNEYNELPTPPDAGDEILRVGLRKDNGNTMVVIHSGRVPQDPAGFAIILADLAQNYAQAVLANGITRNGVLVDEAHVMQRILAVFIDETENPTDRVRSRSLFNS